MSRAVWETSRTIATAIRTKLATARQRIHQAVERSPIRLAHPPARSALATIGCIRVTGIRVTGIVTRLLPKMGKRHTISIGFGRNASELVDGAPNSLEPKRMGSRPSVVAVSAFHPLVPLLGFDAERGNGPGFETAKADRFIRLFAVTVGTVVYPMERRLDF